MYIFVTLSSRLPVPIYKFCFHYSELNSFEYRRGKGCRIVLNLLVKSFNVWDQCYFPS